MTRTFQIGLLIEAFLNISGAAVFILEPSWCLSFVSSSSNQPVPASAAVLWQIYGGLVLALTVPLLLVVPEGGSPTKRAAVFGQRALIFKTLTAGEVILISILAWNASKPTEASGFSKIGLSVSAAFLLPALSWHAFAVWIKQDLMHSGGEDQSAGELKKKS